MKIYEGETFPMKATFRNDEGVLTDPTTPVRVYAKNPDYTVAIDGEVATKKSTGVYTYEHTATVAGKYFRYSFESADGAVESDKEKIWVNESK